MNIKHSRKVQGEILVQKKNCFIVDAVCHGATDELNANQNS